MSGISLVPADCALVVQPDYLTVFQCSIHYLLSTGSVK